MSIYENETPKFNAKYYAQKFLKLYEKARIFEVREDDVFILSYPKTGSRWTQEMVWLILNDLDFKKSQEILLQLRSPFLESEATYDTNVPGRLIQNIVDLESPRCIKSHLYWSLLPNAIQEVTKKPKIVVNVREPMDVCTSYFYHLRVALQMSEDKNEFCKQFLDGSVPYGSYWEHLSALWDRRHMLKILFLKYEEMIHDLAGSIRKVAAFLDKNLSDQDVEKMCEYLKFDSLKSKQSFSNPHLVNQEQAKYNPFMRKGVVGDHKNFMSEETVNAFKKQNEKFAGVIDFFY